MVKIIIVAAYSCWGSVSRHNFVSSHAREIKGREQRGATHLWAQHLNGGNVLSSRLQSTLEQGVSHLTERGVNPESLSAALRIAIKFHPCLHRARFSPPSIFQDMPPPPSRILAPFSPRGGNLYLKIYFQSCSRSETEHPHLATFTLRRQKITATAPVFFQAFSFLFPSNGV